MSFQGREYLFISKVLVCSGIIVAVAGAFEKQAATTIAEAISKFEAKEDVSALKCQIVNLCCQYPPIKKMDKSLGKLSLCQDLSLSDNNIKKIAGLSQLRNLKKLRLNRNSIKSLTGLEGVSETLEELYISNNNIESLSGIHVLQKLKILYMSNNFLTEWSEFSKLSDLSSLEELVLVNNPLEELHTAEGNWREICADRLPNLKKLDGVEVIRYVEETTTACTCP